MVKGDAASRVAKLRFIGLPTVLLHPSPPRMIALEEPELGLLPHAIEPRSEGTNREWTGQV